MAYLSEDRYVQENEKFHQELSNIYSQITALKASTLRVWKSKDKQLINHKHCSLTDAVSAIEHAIYNSSYSK